MVLVGALAVHQLRYRLAGVEPHGAAHAYLPWLQLAVGTLVLAALAEFGLWLWEAAAF